MVPDGLIPSAEDASRTQRLTDKVAKDRATPATTQGYIPVLFTSFLAWTLDAFDFFLVVFALTAIAKEFHKSDAAIALSITLTLAFRPIGAFIFGLLADRFGRRSPLMAVVIFYSVAEVLSGFAPNYAWFLVFRALFGIGMGGEWGVGASLAMEKVPPKLRGLLSGVLQQGYPVGYLLASVCYFFIFSRWGWRPMFFIGGLPALLALYMRFYIKESAVWEKTRHESWRGLGGAILSNWKLFFYMTLLMTAMNFVSHGTQDLYPTFLERVWKLGPSPRAMITGLSMVAAIAGGLLFALFSDRFGRRRVMIVALAGGMVVIPLWAFPSSLLSLILGAALIQFMVQGAWGIVPAHLSELSPDSVRGFLPGFSYQCGALLASLVAYLEAIAAQRTTYATAMSITAVTVFSFALVMTAIGKERHAIRFAGQP